MRIRLGSDEPLDLEATLRCGQAFRWEKHGDWWFGVTTQGPFKIRAYGKYVEFENAKPNYVREYLGLEDRLSEIYSVISRDRFMKKAIDESLGLRILRQQPWECLISYICATYKSIPAIKKTILNLCERHGEKTRFYGLSFSSFPTASTLARISVRELEQCGLGYRAKYISGTAKMVHEGTVDLEGLRRTTYDQAKKELMFLPGVGPKVADCVLLFSLGKTEAFPVDVWMRRTILRHYAKHLPSDLVVKMKSRKSPSSTEYERLSRFGRSYFGEYAGYAQEYLYHHERLHSRDSE